MCIPLLPMLQLYAGDTVKEDDVIAQIETDKVTIDVKFAGKSGKISQVLVAEGDTVVVGQAVASVEEGDFGSSSSSSSAAAAEAEAPAAAAEPAPAAAAPKPGAAAAPPPPPPKPAAPQQVRAAFLSRGVA
jgi:2-oxoglutarate dehydrogenase E2 component (dihydrolipoamide succinyltransferase)